jgi:DNA-binding LytR/AlgR family response regulator
MAGIAVPPSDLRRFREDLQGVRENGAPCKKQFADELSLTRSIALTMSASKVAIKSQGRILFIDPAEIAAIEAQGNYVLLQQRSGSHLLRESISVTAEKLAPYGFVRIHRSVLVNRAYVEEIQPWNSGEYILRVRGGKEYTVTRTYKKNIKSLARFWIGMDGFLPG